jgi:hypothetical protein
MNTEEHGRAGEPVDAPPVKLQAVVATMSAPVLHDPPPAVDGQGTGTEPVMVLDVPWATLPAPPLRRADLELAAAVSVIVTLLASDLRLGLASGGLTCLVAALRRIDRRISFSFGQGFLGYRADLGWPQGVQEDDDFRWNWKARAVAKGDR